MMERGGDSRCQEGAESDSKKSVGAQNRVGSSSVGTVKVAGMAQVRGAERDLQEKESHHHNLVCWTPDGQCQEGKTPCIGNEAIFIESARMVPVGTEIIIRFASEESEAGQEVAQGTVMWHCPTSDEFNNHEGFGVLIQRYWTMESGADSRVELKEAMWHGSATRTYQANNPF